ncbi:adenylate kinase isoenzyme 1 [Condylostylus longicornis]|uniref:adenylate kinase isoenzyme 1 n=1 Tax=Condylostylus longicornis TaxID=2530218 RepID=UPI00244DAC91|nr:adenylate kinase isoenzyme 1 [Condylostylus longicornis]
MSECPIIWVLGGPGSGKGTQCDRIVAKYNFEHLSTGDLLRAEVASQSEIGSQLSAIMKEGKLVPNEIVLSLLHNAMKKSAGKAKGYLIDGYPREKDQGAAFEKAIAPVNLILYFDCSNETLVKRIMARAAAAAEKRADDNEETVKTRIETFRSNTNLVLEGYPKVLSTINAEREVDAIFKDCCDAIDKVLK